MGYRLRLIKQIQGVVMVVGGFVFLVTMNPPIEIVAQLALLTGLLTIAGGFIYIFFPELVWDTDVLF
ncbi:hypothetical protein EGH22_00445 [Halomicroarcula sp. F28]|uniref:hypothetical protein n=1 Tax=Haloarcula salinisoli TaxID=2487746 RepID=UPI001C73C9D9|nr:hypothetical protein [Halomicroarcula salinisoli]MBX0284783.1 hypothetical protein [Halomicroarcula salinisoli]